MEDSSLKSCKGPAVEHSSISALEEDCSSSSECPLEFSVVAVAKAADGSDLGRARACVLRLRHGAVDTPVFMPVGTKAAIKGLTYSEMRTLGCRLLLSNTYHLALRPTSATLRAVGGVHSFKGWDHNVLTDSGGFQMVSLLALSSVSEEGVRFRSPIDGSHMLLTPEASIATQQAIGSDIVMALDDVVPADSTDSARFEEASQRTVRWLDRCIVAIGGTAKTQALFGILQGGVDAKLRGQCLAAFTEAKRAAELRGFAIGGLSGGESKQDFWRTVRQCVEALPDSKPRYVMGVGFALDLVVCTALGADMFDCVYCCRTARFGTALTRSGELSLKAKHNKFDFAAIDDLCECSTCANYSRAALHSMATKYSTCASLLTTHNVHFLLSLMAKMREAIVEQRFDAFVKQFMADRFPKASYPKWTLDAFRSVGIVFDD